MKPETQEHRHVYITSHGHTICAICQEAQQPCEGDAHLWSDGHKVCRKCGQWKHSLRSQIAYLASKWQKTLGPGYTVVQPDPLATLDCPTLFIYENSDAIPPLQNMVTQIRAANAALASDVQHMTTDVHLFAVAGQRPFVQVRDRYNRL